MCDYAVYISYYVTGMKITSMIFPDINWISVNLIVAPEKSLLSTSS